MPQFARSALPELALASAGMGQEGSAICVPGEPNAYKQEASSKQNGFVNENQFCPMQTENTETGFVPLKLLFFGLNTGPKIDTPVFGSETKC